MENDYLTAMLEEYKAQMGCLPGEDSDIGIRMALLAHQLNRLDERLAQLARQADPELAQGTALDRHAASRGLARKPAQTARGILRFSRSSPAAEDIPLPRGLVCAAAGEAGVRYVTTADAVLPAGALQAEVEAAAEQPGRKGNVPAGQITVLVTAAGYVAEVTNPSPFTGGEEEEGDASLRDRLLESYAGISNGSNAAYYRRLALAEEGVYSAQVIPRPRGVGSVDIVIAGKGAPAADEVVQRLAQRVQQQREIGVDAQVFAAGPLSSAVTLALRCNPNYKGDEVHQEVKSRLQELFNRLEVGSPLYVAQMIREVMAVPGVENCRFTAPTGDVRPDERSLAVLGEIAIEEDESL